MYRRRDCCLMPAQLIDWTRTSGRNAPTLWIGPLFGVSHRANGLLRTSYHVNTSIAPSTPLQLFELSQSL